MILAKNCDRNAITNFIQATDDVIDRGKRLINSPSCLENRPERKYVDATIKNIF